MNFITASLRNVKLSQNRVSAENGRSSFVSEFGDRENDVKSLLIREVRKKLNRLRFCSLCHFQVYGTRRTVVKEISSDINSSKFSLSIFCSLLLRGSVYNLFSPQRDEKKFNPPDLGFPHPHSSHFFTPFSDCL